MDIAKFTPLYTPLDIEYQRHYTNSPWHGRPDVGEVPNEPVWYLDFLEDGKLSETSLSLLKAGRQPKPCYTQIIDLTKSEAELHADLRKSYKSLVNKIHVISLMNDIEPLRRLHIRAHGRETRSKETWWVQQKMLWQKEIFVLLMSRFENMRDPYSAVSLAGGIFYYNKHICYYGVGCSVEGASSHALIWQAILHAKKLGCKEFDMGQQVFGGEEKAVNISKFKRGFGGQTRVYLEFSCVEKEK